MLRRLSLVRKLSLVRVPMMASRISTRTRPTLRSSTASTWLRRTGCERPAGGGHLGGVLDPGLLVGGDVGREALGRLRRLRSCDRSRRTPVHDHVEHLVLVEVAGGCLVDDRALAHDQHPVGQAEHLRHLAGDEQDADPRVGEPADEAVDL